MSETPEALIVVVDTNFHFWSGRRGEVLGGSQKDLLTQTELLETMLLFINAFSMSSRENRVAVIANHLDGGHYLFPTPGTPASAEPEHFASVGVQVLESLKGLFQNREALLKKGDSGEGTSKCIGTSCLSGALTMALCYIQRLRKEMHKVDARILVLQATADAREQYIAVMNCIFGAQKMQGTRFRLS
jgi:transcription initiation factor TFIIH subunit 3